MFRHQLLIDAMLKWKTLDYEEIDLLLSKKSLEALQKYREDNEKKRKQATGKIFHFGSIWVGFAGRMAVRGGFIIGPVKHFEEVITCRYIPLQFWSILSTPEFVIT